MENSFFLLFLGLGCVFSSVVSDNSFDYLVLAQFWPPSSCKYFEEKGDSCSIPPKIQGWTIHGLWPSKPNTEKPEFCNDSMTFDYSQIEVLGPQLNLQWHFYDKEKDFKYLWSHEWTKHGTCAFSLPALRGELRYFNKTLQLHSQLNMTHALEKSGVVPSKTKTYNMQEINKAVKNFYSFDPVIVCDYDHKTKMTYLDQIYLCYDKSFNLKDCYPPRSVMHPSRKNSKVSYFSNCEEKDKIQYLPFGQIKSNKRGFSLRFQSENKRG